MVVIIAELAGDGDVDMDLLRNIGASPPHPAHLSLATLGKMRGPLPRGERGKKSQFFNRYPVRKIHQITTRQAARKNSVMPRLTATLTSAIS